MIKFDIETSIDRPVEDVFAYCTDPDKLGTWQTNTVSAIREDEGPLRLGSRLREVHAGPRGKEFHSLVEVSEYDPHTAFGLTVLEGLPVHLNMTFAPTESGTRVAFAAHGQPTGAMRLLQPVLRRTLKRQFTADCLRLKDVLEEGPVSR